MDELLPHCINEIALEGAEGCTFTHLLELLTAQLEREEIVRFDLKDEWVQKSIWNHLLVHPSLSFFIFEEQPNLKVENILTQFGLMTNQNRITLTQENLHFNQIEDNVHIMVNYPYRFELLGFPTNNSLGNISACILVEIGKCRYDGIVNMILTSKLNISSRDLFYHKKKLNELFLIRSKSIIYQSKRTALLKLPRFCREKDKGEIGNLRDLRVSQKPSDTEIHDIQENLEERVINSLQNMDTDDGVIGFRDLRIRLNINTKPRTRVLNLRNIFKKSKRLELFKGKLGQEDVQDFIRIRKLGKSASEIKQFKVLEPQLSQIYQVIKSYKKKGATLAEIRQNFGISGKKLLSYLMKLKEVIGKRSGSYVVKDLDDDDDDDDEEEDELMDIDNPENVEKGTSPFKGFFKLKDSSDEDEGEVDENDEEEYDENDDSKAEVGPSQKVSNVVSGSYFRIIKEIRSMLEKEKIVSLANFTRLLKSDRRTILKYIGFSDDIVLLDINVTIFGRRKEIHAVKFKDLELTDEVLDDFRNTIDNRGKQTFEEEDNEDEEEDIDFEEIDENQVCDIESVQYIRAPNLRKQRELNKFVAMCYRGKYGWKFKLMKRAMILHMAIFNVFRNRFREISQKTVLSADVVLMALKFKTFRETIGIPKEVPQDLLPEFLKISEENDLVVGNIEANMKKFLITPKGISEFNFLLNILIKLDLLKYSGEDPEVSDLSYKFYFNVNPKYNLSPNFKYSGSPLNSKEYILKFWEKLENYVKINKNKHKEDPDLSSIEILRFVNWPKSIKYLTQGEKNLLDDYYRTNPNPTVMELYEFKSKNRIKFTRDRFLRYFYYPEYRKIVASSAPIVGENIRNRRKQIQVQIPEKPEKVKTPVRSIKGGEVKPYENFDDEVISIFLSEIITYAQFLYGKFYIEHDGFIAARKALKNSFTTQQLKSRFKLFMKENGLFRDQVYRLFEKLKDVEIDENEIMKNFFNLCRNGVYLMNDMEKVPMHFSSKQFFEKYELIKCSAPFNQERAYGELSVDIFPLQKFYFLFISTPAREYLGEKAKQFLDVFENREKVISVMVKRGLLRKRKRRKGDNPHERRGFKFPTRLDSAFSNLSGLREFGFESAKDFFHKLKDPSLITSMDDQHPRIRSEDEYGNRNKLVFQIDEEVTGFDIAALMVHLIQDKIELFGSLPFSQLDDLSLSDDESNIEDNDVEMKDKKKTPTKDSKSSKKTPLSLPKRKVRLKDVMLKDVLLESGGEYDISKVYSFRGMKMQNYDLNLEFKQQPLLLSRKGNEVKPNFSSEDVKNMEESNRRKREYGGANFEDISLDIEMSGDIDNVEQEQTPFRKRKREDFEEETEEIETTLKRAKVDENSQVNQTLVSIKDEDMEEMENLCYSKNGDLNALLVYLKIHRKVEDTTILQSIVKIYHHIRDQERAGITFEGVLEKFQEEMNEEMLKKYLIDLENFNVIFSSGFHENLYFVYEFDNEKLHFFEGFQFEDPPEPESEPGVQIPSETPNEDEDVVMEDNDQGADKDEPFETTTEIVDDGLRKIKVPVFTNHEENSETKPAVDKYLLNAFLKQSGELNQQTATKVKRYIFETLFNNPGLSESEILNKLSYVFGDVDLKRFLRKMEYENIIKSKKVLVQKPSLFDDGVEEILFYYPTVDGIIKL